MAYIIDTRNSEDHLVVLGGALGLPTSSYTVYAPIDGSVRYNVVSGDIELYRSGWQSIVTNATVQPYVVALASGASTLFDNQIIACHRFACAVTFAADFGAGASGLTSGAGCLSVTTNIDTFTLQVCDAADNPTMDGNWTTIGTAVIQAADYTAVLATVGHSAKSVAQGDFLRCRGPSTADPTLANFFITLVGTR